MPYNDQPTTNEAQTIVEVASRAAAPTPVEPGRIYLAQTPAGPRTVDLTGPEFTGKPPRKTGTTTVSDAASFHTYFTKHSDADSEVYADARQLTVTAVLDAHTADEPRWAGHLLTLRLQKTATWQAWTDRNGKYMGQEEFADFLDDHRAELVDPDSATMLEIAQSLQATTKAEFKSAARLSNGQRQLTYVESVQGRAGSKGELRIPERFTIGLEPFEGAPGYQMDARFRYRISGDGVLTMAYRLDRPDVVLSSAFADVVGAIEERIEQSVMRGTHA